MVWLKKKVAGSAPGFTWKNDGDVLDVPEELALELLERPGDHFTEGEPPEDDPDKDDADTKQDGDGDTGDGDTAGGDEAVDTKKRATRRTKVSE